MILSAYGTINYDNVNIADIINSTSTFYNRIKGKYVPSIISIDYDIRPDALAFRLYGNPNLQWVFALLNPQIKDGGFNDWLLSEESLYNFTMNKYNGKIDEIHHHRDTEGRTWFNMTNKPDNPKKWFNKNDDGEETIYSGVLIPVTNLEFERTLNETKFRNIAIINPKDIDQFISDLLGEIRKSQRPPTNANY